MTGLLNNLIFLNPWLLTALATLPALWFLLRIMPPAPKRLFLPSAAFLEGLLPREKTPSHTPWWILLMRILAVLLVILAFAGPVIHPSSALPGNGAIRILINNDWASAHLWDEQVQTAQDILAQAAREEREVYVVTTAPTYENNGKPAGFGPMSAAEASAVMGGLSPLPWEANYQSTNAIIGDQADAYTYWLSHGITRRGAKGLAETLNTKGGFQLYKPRPEDLAVSLSISQKNTDAFALNVPDALPNGISLTLQALNEAGSVIGLQTLTKGGDTPLDVIELDMPETLLRDVQMLRIAERRSAGATYIASDRFAKKAVGIVTPDTEANEKPFIEAGYYLTRALEPYADITTGPMEDLLSDTLSMIILPDTGAIPAGLLNRLENWVEKGGLLLRFAGPNMTEAQNFLLPVPLRQGKRALDGALTWDTPPKLAPFPENSPFYGIDVHDDVVIRQQLLAEPVEDLSEKTWARLDDGTPLVTARPLDNGLLVMVHTSASSQWSDLPLSGVFVKILNRLVKLAGSAPDSLQTANGALSPLWVFDGFGRINDPPAHLRNIDAGALDDIDIGFEHPPGLYGRGAVQTALNLGAHIEPLQAISHDFTGTQPLTYGQTHEQNLAPYLLVLAMTLLLLDWLVMLVLSSAFSFRLKRASVAMILLGLLAVSSIARADTATDMRYASGLYLAYIKNADPSINATSQQGMEKLVEALNRRTSAEPDGVAALDPETDSLAFFPLIYWPVSTNDASLSETALLNIQSYLDHGGTVLFDTRGADMRSGIFQKIAGGLDIPALQPAPEDHVLGRTFYLLDSYPGLYSGETLWVESTSASGRDGVSSVIIGATDWAGAWAQGSGQYYRSSAQSRQNEMAMRFGVNLVMYALTGNYKADQVHVNTILERLGQ